MHLLIDPSGALIATVESGSFVSFNGGQDLLPDGGAVLAKVNPANGHIVWRTPIPIQPDGVFLAPGDRIVTVTNTGDGPYSVRIYAGSDGSFLSTISGSGVVRNGVVACGRTEMYLMGTAPTATDFDPGSATDVLGADPGIFVSRFSFE
jgi:hypothetical protein